MRFGVVVLDVGVEGGGIGGDVNGIGSMEVRGAQRYCRRVSYADMEKGGRGQYPVFGRRVGKCVSVQRLSTVDTRRI